MSETISVIRSERLRAFREVQHAMSTRNGGVSPAPFGMNLSFNVGDDEDCVRRNRERFFSIVGAPLNRIAFPRQIHGDRILRVHSPGVYEDSDALMTNERGLFLVVSVADCGPILFYDHRRKAIAAVHAGWRGSALGISARAVSMMNAEFQSSPEDLHVYVGPCAGVCCYEVGEEVAARFPEEVVDRSRGPRPHLDVKQYNALLLGRQGVPSHQIEIAPECTICNGSVFHSYRRDGNRSGRMMAIIGLSATGNEG